MFFLRQDPGPKDLLEIAYGPAGAPPSPLPTVLRQPSMVPINDNTKVRPFVLREQEDPAGGLATFRINGQRWPEITPVSATRGDVEIWELEAAARVLARRWEPHQTWRPPP